MNKQYNNIEYYRINLVGTILVFWKNSRNLKKEKYIILGIENDHKTEDMFLLDFYHIKANEKISCIPYRREMINEIIETKQNNIFYVKHLDGQ